MADKIKSIILPVFLFCMSPLYGTAYGINVYHAWPKELYNTPISEIEEGLLTVQNTEDANKARIKERMKYIDKVIQEIDQLLYSKNKASREVLQKIKRLLTELEKMQKSGNHY